MKQTGIDRQTLRLSKQAILNFCLIGLLILFTQCKKETTQSNNSLSETSVDGALTQTTPTSNQTVLGDETLDQITPTSDETAFVDGTLTQATPTSETSQIIEKEYGEWLRADPDLLFVPPAITPSLSLEEQRRQLTEIWEEQNKRARDLYEKPYYFVAYEFANPLFEEVFPEAKMFAVMINANTTDEDMPYFITMVSFDGQDYRMPMDFNQLMVDAGYQLTDETRDILAHAYIIAGMPTEMAAHPVTCMPGREIDRELGTSKVVYEIDCTIVYQGIGDATVTFYSLDSFFRGAFLHWGLLQENGWRESGHGMASYPLNN